MVTKIVVKGFAAVVIAWFGLVSGVAFAAPVEAMPLPGACPANSATAFLDGQCSVNGITESDFAQAQVAPYEFGADLPGIQDAYASNTFPSPQVAGAYLPQEVLDAWSNASMTATSLPEIPDTGLSSAAPLLYGDYESSIYFPAEGSNALPSPQVSGTYLPQEVLDALLLASK